MSVVRVPKSSDVYRYPLAIKSDTWCHALDLFHAFSAGVGIARTAQAEEQARSTVHVDYEAFEAEFMRLVESAAARAIVESGL